MRATLSGAFFLVFFYPFMTHYKTITSGLLQGTREIPYGAPHGLFTRLHAHGTPEFLLESKDISSVYGRLSLIGIQPVLKLHGKNEHFEITVTHERGLDYLRQLTPEDLSFCDMVEMGADAITGIVYREEGLIEERQRSTQRNIARIIRKALQKFAVSDRALLGLYGAFSYDFVRLFESIPDLLPENDVDDFTLFLFDTFIFFDHLREKTEIVAFRKNTQAIEQAINDLYGRIEAADVLPLSYEIKDPSFTLDQRDYEALVLASKEYMRRGDLFEVVFSNILKARFSGDPLGLYLAYRELNPSPYLFYFDFGAEQLVGSSPEMMVRCEGRKVHLRPISGTARRGNDPLEDHEAMLSLLTDEKERAELDMLIDLGRNDLSRICKPGLRISDYRFVEKYSRVMHTVAHLTGELRDGTTALDALIGCLNAGTLTGAPKVEAMKTIERHEKERRGYYGGALGYLTFSGELDTGIIIRTAHIRDGTLRFQVGATLLQDSDPAKEYQETMAKAEAFLTLFKQVTSDK